MAALLLNRISRILRVNHFLRKKIMYHIQKVLRGKLETRIFFNEQGHSVFAVGSGEKPQKLWPSHLENDLVLECHRRKCGMDVSRGKNICKEHLVNIWFFGDSFITLKTIQRGVLLTYGLAL